MAKLEDMLRPLGIQPVLKVREIDENRSRRTRLSQIAIGSQADLWRNGLVREWEAVAVVQFVVNQSAERWRQDAATFEVIAEALFLRAALIAVSHLNDI